jgi:hypothetical protein
MIAIHKQKLQQTSSAVKDKLQKAVFVTMDPDDCGRSRILELIQYGGEYERLHQNAKLKLVVSDSTRNAIFISLIHDSRSINKVTTKFYVSQYTVRKERSLQKTCGILSEVE